jgi:hypothetical protein
MLARDSYLHLEIEVPKMVRGLNLGANLQLWMKESLDMSLNSKLNKETSVSYIT